MLRSLSIRNLAIIDRLDVEFGRGLTVLTGETGAGKSIILGALNLILGGKGGTELVRGGADRAVVDAIFDVSGSPTVEAAAREMGFDVEEGDLLLSREIAATGKSAARIMGRPATVAQLKQLGEWLVDLHGQHEHQSLLVVSRQLDMLDAWGGLETLALREETAAAFQQVRALERERASIETDARERVRLMDLYQFQVEEISSANLDPDEEEQLRADSRRLANAQKLAEAAAGAEAALAGEGAGVLELLASVGRSLEDASAMDEALAPIAEAITGARYGLEEATRDLARYADTVEFNPARLEQVEERLDLLQSLKRKYGDTLEEVISYGCEAAEKLEALAHSEQRGQELDVELAAAQERLNAVTARLTQRRTTVASEFADAVLAELNDLAMDKTRFQVDIQPDEPSARGADRVEFLIAPNPGEPLRPLARIASGGEISRVMLAIKSAMARQDPLPTMLFDEIDAGIGGRTASVVADKLATLAETAQILCITHLPQIASRATSHFYIEKRVERDRTSTFVTPLTPDERVEELARMLGGAEVTDTVLRHAREMLRAG